MSPHARRAAGRGQRPVLCRARGMACRRSCTGVPTSPTPRPSTSSPSWVARCPTTPSTNHGVSPCSRVPARAGSGHPGMPGTAAVVRRPLGGPRPSRRDGRSSDRAGGCRRRARGDPRTTTSTSTECSSSTPCSRTPRRRTPRSTSPHCASFCRCRPAPTRSSTSPGDGARAGRRNGIHSRTAPGCEPVAAAAPATTRPSSSSAARPASASGRARCGRRTSRGAGTTSTSWSAFPRGRAPTRLCSEVERPSRRARCACHLVSRMPRRRSCSSTPPKDWTG